MDFFEALIFTLYFRVQSEFVYSFTPSFILLYTEVCVPTFACPCTYVHTCIHAHTHNGRNSVLVEITSCLKDRNIST